MTSRPAIRPISSVLFAVLSVLFFVSPVVAQSASEQEALVASALRNRDYSRALGLLRPALRQFPENAQLWTMNGVASAGQGNEKEALASFHRALKIAPNTIPALQGAAQIEFDNASPRAIPLLERLLILRPNEPTTHGMVAVLEFQQGNCAKAVPHFEKAEALFQSKVEALHAYAICLVRLKQFEKAASVLKRAAELKGGDSQDLRLLASVELMAQRPEAALSALQPVLASGNLDAETLELAASAYEGVHDTEKAVNALRQAILLQPTNADLYVDFANLSSDHQSFQIGINIVNDGLALQPQSAALYFARGMLYAQLADYDKAETDFEKAYELDPNQSLSVAAQSILAMQQNDLSGALKTIGEELAGKPNDAILLYLKADILSQLGVETGSAEFQTALRSAKRSVALASSLAPAHAVLAKLYLQMGQYQQAVTECRKAIALNPKDQTSIYRLIQALRKTGNVREVPDLLKRLTRLREDATKNERERYRYKLVEGAQSNP